MRKDARRERVEQRRRWRSSVLAGAMLFAAAAAPRPVAACGYENPSDIALGLLNWVFPEALHVRSAVWQAEKIGILPPRPAKPARDLFGAEFRQAAASMVGLRVRMNSAASPAAGMPSFSVVLIPAVMWTTYTPSEAGYTTEVHTEGPAKGDVIIVTDEKVVRALVDGSLDAVAAERYGLIRFYGPADRQDQLRALLASLPSTSGEFGSSNPG